MAGYFFLGETTEIERKKEERLFFHNEEVNGFNKSLELWPQFVNKEPFSIDGFLDDSNRSSFVVMRQQGGGMNCQDCGNQSKKDCPYFRCRTCCKSRGFRCQTHVRSTWVPAAERRQRQQRNVAMGQQEQQQHEPPAFRVDQSLRRRREDQIGPSIANYLPTDTTQGFGGTQFPTEVNSPADFQCVRLSPSMDEGDEEYAYQTAVNIGGRVFRGILYDQGPDVNPYGESSSRGGFASQPSHLNVLAAASSAAASTASNPPGGSPLLDPSLYPPPLHTFMDDTQFFPPTTKP